MSWRMTLVQILDVVLRVPPLFVIDAIFNGHITSVLSSWIEDDELIEIGLCFLLFFVICVCLIGVALTTNQLLTVYSTLLSLGILIISLFFNNRFVIEEVSKSIVHGHDAVPMIGTNLCDVLVRNPHGYLNIVIVQCVLAFCYNSLKLGLLQDDVYIKVTHWKLPVRTVTYLLFLQSTLFCLVSLPPQYLKHVPIFSLTLAGVELVTSILAHASILGFFRNSWKETRERWSNFGIEAFVEAQWHRMHIPVVLRVFWITRAVHHLVLLAASPDRRELHVDEAVVEVDIVSQVLIDGCDTMVALLGMTSIVAYAMHYVGELFAFIVGTHGDDDKHMGSMSAVLFFILALQTGLTSMPPEKRLSRLHHNLCLLMTAMLHFVHGMVHPQLMQLSAGQNVPTIRHVRVLATCAFLVVFPAAFVAYLWMENGLSTWLLAVTVFGIEIVIKVLISLVTYGLFMLDTKSGIFWEGLDDYIYYVRSTGNVIEFLFGVFLFGNGAWILLYESGGTIRAVMMCIHVYFNIWGQACQGWKVFMKRRTAAKKIGQLAEATPDQLTEYADVCAICYQPLTSARITTCRHMFHGTCLRKWLYIQDKCPMCHHCIFVAPNSPQQQKD